MLTVGSILIGKVIDVDYLGQGIIKSEDIVIFVPGLLLNEVVQIKIKTLKKRFAEAEVLQMIEVSPKRRNHPDMHLGSMDLLHMNDEEQLNWQAKLTKDTFKKIAGIEIDIEPILTNHQFTHYRNKSVFHVMNVPKLTLGLYHKNGSGLIKVDSFLLADELTNKILHELIKSQIEVDSINFKQLMIRTNSKQQALVTLVCINDQFKGLDDIIRVLKNTKEVIGITVNYKDSKNKILGSKSKVVYGENSIDEYMGQWHFPVSDQSFFQVNVDVILKAYHLIKTWMIPKSTLIDAYSGVGSIGYYLSDVCHHLTMIESNPDAYSMALAIKDRKQLQNVDVILGQVERELSRFDADVIVFDPPRNGLMPEMIDVIKAKRFIQVFYLSCDLKTLSRDIKGLMDTYEIKKVVPIRMFPQTTECETLVMLHLKS